MKQAEKYEFDYHDNISRSLVDLSHAPLAPYLPLYITLTMTAITHGHKDVSLLPDHALSITAERTCDPTIQVKIQKDEHLTARRKLSIITSHLTDRSSTRPSPVPLPP